MGYQTIYFPLNISLFSFGGVRAGPGRRNLVKLAGAIAKCKCNGGFEGPRVITRQVQTVAGQHDEAGHVVPLVLNAALQYLQPVQLCRPLASNRCHIPATFQKYDHMTLCDPRCYSGYDFHCHGPKGMWDFCLGNHGYQGPWACVGIHA
jgi:hypothetical protein